MQFRISYAVFIPGAQLGGRSNNKVVGGNHSKLIVTNQYQSTCPRESQTYRVVADVL
jgi:hypothetical protein